MNVSRQKYRLDDYLQDKAQRAASPLTRGGASGLRQGMGVTPTGNTSVGTVKPLPVRPPHTVQRPSESSYRSSSADGGQNVTGDIIKPDTGTGAGGGVLTQSQMTTAYTKQLMENALSNLLAMQNRKFKYDARSSPLYSIVQKQAEENARLASGRAYAQAKGATGGYGSSYAALAADEAGRQAMRELDDQQLALYEAARAEFEAENASALDWYNTTKQLYADAEALERLEAKKTISSYTREDGTTAEVDDTKVQGAYDYIASALQSGGSIEQVENTIREGLRNQRTAEGEAYTEDEINAAIERYKRVEGAAVADTQKNTAAIADKGLNRISDLSTDDLATLGIDATAWGEMDEGSKKATLLDTLGQARKDGKLSTEKYMKYIGDDVAVTLGAIKSDDVKKKASELADLALDLEGYKDNGYLTEQEYTDMIDGILEKIDPEKLMREQTRSLGEKITGTDNDESGLNELIDMGIGFVASGGNPLVAALGSAASQTTWIYFTKEERNMLEYLIGRKKVNQFFNKQAKGVTSRGK